MSARIFVDPHAADFYAEVDAPIRSYHVPGGDLSDIRWAETVPVAPWPCTTDPIVEMERETTRARNEFLIALGIVLVAVATAFAVNWLRMQ